VLDAAVAEFAAHGYAGARIAAIAKRAGVNQQLISYYFDGKEGLFRAMSDSWGERASTLVEPGTSLPEQLRRYVLEALENRDGMRLLAWGGLEYTGPEADPDHAPRTERLADSVSDIRERQKAGALPKEMDPACLTVMLMAAAMAPVTLPHVIAGVCGEDPQSPEFIERFADQLALLVRQLGLGAG
jgi:AcrR family transcriptional regulator